MDRLECSLFLPWDALLFTSTKCTLETQKPKKTKIKEADESFRNAKCHAQVRICLPFWEKHGVTQSCPSLHVIPHPLVSSLLRLLLWGCSEREKKTGNDLGFIPMGLFFTWIFSRGLFVVQLHKKEMCLQKHRGAICSAWQEGWPVGTSR